MAAEHRLPVLRTERLRLRPRVLADLEACFDMDREPGTLAHIDWPGSKGSWEDDEAHRRFIRARIDFPYPPGLGYWVIEPADSPSRFLGWVLLIPENTTGPEIEIGWRLVRAARGEGFATEAARALLDHCFTATDIDVVVAEIHRTNAASLSVARKLGMRDRGDPARTTQRCVLWELTRRMWAAATE